MLLLCADTEWDMHTFEELERRDIAERPYMVVCDDAEAAGPPPTFKTWDEALAAQKRWNKDFPGHRAMKRKGT